MDRPTSVSVYCPHCHRFTALSLASGTLLDENGNSIGVSPRDTPVAMWITFRDTTVRGNRHHLNLTIRWWIGICNACQRPMLVRNDGEQVFPNPLPPPTDEHIPEEIRESIDEAKLCLSVGAYRACAVMSRLAIQLACINKGAKKDNKIHQQIDHLRAQGIITQDVKDWADLARWIGNSGAHPDDKGVDKEDAEDSVHLVEQLCHILFVTPAIAKEQAQKRSKIP